MSDTTFVNGTPVVPAWLNDVNDLVYAFPSLAISGTKNLVNTSGTLSWSTSSGGLNGLGMVANGADGTGVVDCASIMTTLIAALPAVGGVIIFEAGYTFKLGAVNCNGKKFTIYADGATINYTSTSGSIQKTDHGNTLNIIGGTWSGADGAIAIKYNATASGTMYVDMLVSKAKFTSTNAFCVELRGCRETAFSQCEFSTTSGTSAAFSGGVYLTQANNAYFSQCFWNGQGKGYGVFADGAGSPNSANPILESCEILGWNIGYKIVGFDDGHLSNCTIDYNLTANVYISSQDVFKITGGYIGGGIDGVSNIPAITITSEGGMSYAPDISRFITLNGVHFVGHQTSGTLMDLVVITAPSSSYYSAQIFIKGCHFQQYTRYGINFSTNAQLTLEGNSFTPIGTATEPTSSPIYNALGTNDSFVLITNNQFPNGTTLAGSSLSSARLFNNPGYDGVNGVASFISQLNGYTGIGGFGASYFHWVDQKGPMQLDRFAGTPTFRLRRAAGTKAAPTVVGNTDQTLNLIGDAYNGSAFSNVAAIQMYADGAQSGSASPGRLVLSTAHTGTQSLTSRVEVDSAGNIFVNPTALSGSGRIYFGGSSSGTASLGIFYGTGSPESSVTANPGSLYLSTSGTLYTKATGTGNTGWSASAGTASYVRATNTATAAIGASGTFTKVVYTNEVVDTLNEWSSSTFTATVAGIYSFASTIQVVPGGTVNLNEQIRVDLYKNGSRILAGQAAQAQAASTYNSITSISGTIDLVATDTLEFYVWNNTGFTATLGGSTIGTWATIARVA